MAESASEAIILDEGDSRKQVNLHALQCVIEKRYTLKLLSSVLGVDAERRR